MADILDNTKMEWWKGQFLWLAIVLLFLFASQKSLAMFFIILINSMLSIDNKSWTNFLHRFHVEDPG